MAGRPRYGHVAIVLHSHMPYVLGHGRWPHGVDWLSEAVAESYVPIINMASDLAAAGVRAGLTISTSPVLVEQLSDPRFPGEFNRYLTVKETAAAENAREFAADGRRHLADLAEGCRSAYAQVRSDFFDRYGRDLVGALRRLQNAGAIEVMTCAATHGYLPLLREDRCIRAQVRLAVQVYERHYGRRPRGIWLPECAYRPRGPWVDPLHPADGPVGERPGIEEFLADEGLEYFIVDLHLLQGGEPGGLYAERYEALRELSERAGGAGPPEPAEANPHRIHLTSSHPFFEKTVAFFTRESTAALQVWSGQFGYPGDPYYLDFHKKHWPGGLRYWRVTDPKADLGAKELYEPAAIEARLAAHVDHYTELLRDLLKAEAKGRRPDEDGGVVCVPFDAELFGHWWYEGPRFLEQLLRRLAADPDVRPTTCAAELERHTPTRVVRLPEGSWGLGGKHLVWWNDQTRWTWECVHEAESRMTALISAYGDHVDPTLRGLIAQAGRSLLLLEASDWQFIISARDAADYATERVRRHCSDFNRLAQMADRVGQGLELTTEDLAFLKVCTERDALFREAGAPLWQ